MQTCALPISRVRNPAARRGAGGPLARAFPARPLHARQYRGGGAGTWRAVARLVVPLRHRNRVRVRIAGRERRRLGKATDLAALPGPRPADGAVSLRSEEHTSELQSLMRSSYAVFCLKKKKKNKKQ